MVALWQTGTTYHIPTAFCKAMTTLCKRSASIRLAAGWRPAAPIAPSKSGRCRSNEVRRTLRGHDGFHLGVELCARWRDRSRQAVSDGSVKLWSATTGRAIRTLTSHTSRVTLVAFSANGGDVFASAAEDGTVRLRGLKRSRLYGALSNLGPGAKTSPSPMMARHF